MSVRSLGLVLCLTFVSWLVAGAALVRAIQETNQERVALVSFVCATIDIRQHEASFESQEIARRFIEILDELGESCRAEK